MSQKLWETRDWCVTIILLVTLMMTGGAYALKKSDVPSAVLASFAKSFKGIEAVGYDSESAMGRTLFEIQTKSGKFEKDFIYLADGSLVQIEEQIEVSSLPASVSATASMSHPGYRLKDAERITRGTIVEYEVSLENDSGEIELLISADGKILPSVESDEDGESPTDDESE